MGGMKYQDGDPGGAYGGVGGLSANFERNLGSGRSLRYLEGVAEQPNQHLGAGRGS